MKISSPVTHLRIFSLLDALSYLYLLYCAIYLKRMLGDDSAIKIPGMIHGVIFCFFGAALLWTTTTKNWSMKRFSLVGCTALVPLLPFWLETWLRKQEDT